MFSRKVREIFKNKFFYRTPPAAASGSVKMETQASRNTQNKTYSKSKGQNMSQICRKLCRKICRKFVKFSYGKKPNVLPQTIFQKKVDVII